DALQRGRAGVQHVATPVPGERHGTAVRIPGASVLRGASRSETGAEGELQHEITGAVVEMPLPWERLLWTGRAGRAPRTPCYLTDLRIVRLAGDHADELALYDVADVSVSQTAIQRWLRTWTLTINARDRRRTPLVLKGIRRAPQLSAALHLLTSDPGGASIDA